MSKATVLIVNPISSVKFLAIGLKQNQIKSIALYTEALDKDFLADLQTEFFDECICIKNASVDQILNRLYNYNINFVLNGCDQTVKLCEELSNKICPDKSNNLETSYIRASKYNQQNALAKLGLPIIKQHKIDCSQMIDDDVLDGLSYPIFAKPVKGAGTIGAGKANTKEELLKILKTRPKSIFFEDTNEYIIQEYLYGDELVVDTFSAEGKHFIANIYTYSKETLNNLSIYRQISILNNQLVRQQLSEFAYKCLDACEIKFGLSHLEFFQLPDKSFRMIEINPRISGGCGSLNKLTKLIGGTSQDILIAKYLNGTLNKYKTTHEYKYHGTIVIIYDHRPINFNKYPSFKECIIFQDTPLDPQKNAINVLDIRKYVLLAHEDYNQLQEDANKLISEDII